jgi:hypothetical protein
MPATQALLSFFAGMTFFGVAVHQWSLALRVPYWPVADGTIDLSEVDEGGEASAPRVCYRYRVQGMEFRGDALFPGGFSVGAGRTWAESMVAEYPKGARVWVRYDPDDPTRSTLAVQLPLWAHLIMWAGAAGFTLLGICIARSG